MAKNGHFGPKWPFEPFSPLAPDVGLRAPGAVIGPASGDLKAEIL